MTQSQVTLFSKPNCQYCDRAKAVLKRANVNYQEYDVTASERNADASIYFSGVATVPQIFLGDYHINGAEDLEKLEKSGRLVQILKINKNNLPLDNLSDEQLHQGAKDTALREYIPQSNGSQDNEAETLPILHFYKEFFGFWPNSFSYLHHWKEAYQLFFYCNNFSAASYAKKSLGMNLLCVVGYSTSNAHGCSYCEVHSAATGGEQSLGIVEQFKKARQGEAGEDNPFSLFEIALADLAAEATRNQVEEILLNRIHNLADNDQKATANIEATTLVTTSFGFLNVFNDLTGLKIEGDWATQAQERVGIEAGRHGAEDSNPANLDYELPKGDLSIQDMLAKYDGAIDNLEAYAKQEFGLLPAWIKNWSKPLRATQAPELNSGDAPLQKRHAYFYGEIMGNREHTLIPSELKHLMARVSAIAKNHDYLAAVEGYMAYHAATDKEQAIDRIRQCFIAATNREDTSSIFSEKEKAALQLAWLSAQIPLTTPYRFINRAIELYQPQELIHLLVVCGISSMVQRFVAISQPKMETEVSQFYTQHSIETVSLLLRYPLSLKL